MKKIIFIVLAFIMLCGFACAIEEPALPNDNYTVYVYVAGKNDEGEILSDECLTLLGVDPNSLDVEGYFPIGEIKLTNYLAAAGYSSIDEVPQNTGLIISSEILAAIEEDLTGLSTINLENGNTNNLVTNYVNQVIAYYEKTGSDGQSTMLCRKDSAYKSSHGFSNENQYKILFHLDLCFNTEKISFVLGNNNLSNDGTVVDTRTYIKGCAIQEPIDFSSSIPEHYFWDGEYYEDADFTIKWDGIGTPLNEEEVVYIKLTEEEKVTVNYVVASGEGALDKDTETIYLSNEFTGSKATPADGYTFDRWYADAECTIPLESVDGIYIPSEKVATTYYAKFSLIPVVEPEQPDPVIPTPTPSIIIPTPTPSPSDDTTIIEEEDTPLIDNPIEEEEEKIDTLTPEEVIEEEEKIPLVDIPETEEIETNNNSVEVVNEDIPYTGDNNDMVIYITLAFIAIVGLSAVALLFKRFSR